MEVHHASRACGRRANFLAAVACWPGIGSELLARRAARCAERRRRLGERKIAFLCAREYIGPDRLGPKLKAAFGGVYITNEKFNFETAERTIEAGEADAVAFGKLFIANPDLPQRFALRAPLNEPRPGEFYAGGAQGYTDYPSLTAGRQSPDLNSSHARVNARVSSAV
jgi:hypothetical protein